MRPVSVLWGEDEENVVGGVKPSHKNTALLGGLSCMIGCFALVSAIFIFIVYRTSVPRVVGNGISSAVLHLRAHERRRDSFASLKGGSFASQVHYVLNIVRSDKKDSQEVRDLAVSIVRESVKANYDPLLVASVIKAESTFNGDAVSYVGAKGLMQIRPDTGRYISLRNNMGWKGATKLHEAEYNISLGIAYLKQLEQQFHGNIEHALIAYNWGPGNLIKAMKGGKHIPQASIKYARSILSRRTKWHKEYLASAPQVRGRETALS